MNKGAREANDSSRHLTERADRETMIKLLADIRELLKQIAEHVKPVL